MNALRALHASLKDYLLLLGEPIPLLGTVCLLLTETVELLGRVPADTSEKSFDKLSNIILCAAILGIVDRIEGIDGSDPCIKNIKSFMKATETLLPCDRRDMCFKVLGMALKNLNRITGIEYPYLVDGDGQKLTGEDI